MGPDPRRRPWPIWRASSSPRPAPYEGAVEELTLLKANSPYSEVEWTAAEILRLVREEGYRFRDIAVCARSLEDAAPSSRPSSPGTGCPCSSAG